MWEIQFATKLKENIVKIIYDFTFLGAELDNSIKAELLMFIVRKQLAIRDSATQIPCLCLA